MHTPLLERQGVRAVSVKSARLMLSVDIMLSSLCLLVMLLWTWWLQLLWNSKMIINSVKTITDLEYQSLDNSSASTYLEIHLQIFEFLSPKRYLGLITTAPWDFSAFSVSPLSWPSLIFYNVPPSPFAQFLFLWAHTFQASLATDKVSLWCSNLHSNSTFSCLRISAFHKVWFQSFSSGLLTFKHVDVN